jgi:N-acetylmuramoyl-L-alanine amidase
VLAAVLAVLATLGSATAGAAAPLPYVAIDAGHGDKDGGAIGLLPPGMTVAPGLPARVDSQGRPAIMEKDVNLDIAQRLDGWLRGRGGRTIMTRTTDLAGGDRPYTTVGADLKARTDIANEVGVDLFLSIHNNALTPEITGTETYHYYYASIAAQTLARYVQGQMLQALGLPNRGIRRAGFYVLRNTVMPAVLVECGFMTNPRDVALLADPAKRQAIAEGLGRAIRRYADDPGPTRDQLLPTLGPWKKKPRRIRPGYKLVKTGPRNLVGKGGWIAVRADYRV